MNKLIVIAGLSGTGKTTIANALSQKTGLACIHKDSLKAALYDELHFQTTETYKFFYNLIEEQIRNQANLIVEATFAFKEDIILLETWKRKYNFELFFIICNAEKELRKERILKRKRHISHIEADEKALEVIDKENFAFENVPGNILRVDTSKKIDLIIDDILSWINS